MIKKIKRKKTNEKKKRVKDLKQKSKQAIRIDRDKEKGCRRIITAR